MATKSKKSPLATVYEKVSTLIAAFDAIDPLDAGKSKIPPDYIDLAGALDNLNKTATKKVIDPVKEAVREIGAAVTGGDYVAAFSATNRRTPTWKDIAIEQARQLAKAKGKTFDEKKFVEEQQENAPVVSSGSISFQSLASK